MLAFLAFFSCKRTDTQNVETQKPFEEFFSKKVAEGTKFRAEVARSIRSNLALSNKKTMVKGDSEIKAILIGAGFKNNNNSQKEVSNIFVLTTNKTKNEAVGYVYQYHVVSGTDTKAKAQEEVLKVATGAENLADGKVTVIIVHDVYLYKMTARNGKLYKMKYLKKDKGTARTGSGCTDWYYVEYNYITQEIISQTYLFTNCGCLELRTNPENAKIADPDNCSFGGGNTNNLVYSYNDGMAILNAHAQGTSTPAMMNENITTSNGTSQIIVKWKIFEGTGWSIQS